MSKSMCLTYFLYKLIDMTVVAGIVSTFSFVMANRGPSYRRMMVDPSVTVIYVVTKLRNKVIRLRMETGKELRK